MGSDERSEDYGRASLDIISSFTYDAATYVHQGEWSEDHQLLYVNDEMDEVVGQAAGRNGDHFQTYIFNASDLMAPVYAGAYADGVAHPSIDHNLYVKDGYVYQAA